jgi:predicted permease
MTSADGRMSILIGHSVQRWMDDIGRDVRGAVRFLRRTPGFTVPAIVSLALGIAVNTTMFSVVNAVLFRPLGVPGDGELVRIGWSVRNDGSFRSASLDELRYLREHASSVANILGHQIESVVVAGPDGAFPVSSETVTTTYFATLGVRPAVGRGFAADEERASVVVISDRFWQRHFAGASTAVGAKINLNTHPFTIIGVAPPAFAGTFPGVDVDVWFPAHMSNLVLSRQEGTADPSFLLIARLKAGASVASARSEIEMLGRRMVVENPQRDRDRSFAVASAQGVHPGFARVARVFLFLLMGIVGVVLLVACANVASMVLARATSRRAELAVRLACGASRGRVIRQLLAESVVLAIIGASMGILLSVWAIRALNALSVARGPTGTPVFFGIRLDVRVLAFTAAMTTVTALAFGLAPAFQAARVDVISALKSAAPVVGRSRLSLRGVLIVLQVALSFVLLVAATLLFQSVRNSGHFALGFEPDGVVVASFDPQVLGYPEATIASFYDELLRRTRALPGAEHAALSEHVPMRGSGGVSIRLSHTTPTERAINAPVNRVSPGYFATIRQPLIRGRDFSAADQTGRVAVVNESLARRLWPNEDPIGKRIVVGDAEEREVVGVARNALFASFDGEVGPFIFLPIRAGSPSRLTLNLRTSAPTASALADIARIVRDVDVNIAVHEPSAMRERMAFRLVPVRIARGVFGIAGMIALMLAAGGLYGLVAYALAQRLKEIGIRVALGATRRNVFQVIVGNAFRLTTIGIVIGALLGAAAMRLFTSLLYGLSPTDPLTFGSIAGLLLVVTTIAGYVAARRGLAIDASQVLRGE